MVWNFSYTIPSIIFLTFFLIFYFLKPVLLTQSNKYFLSIVILETIGFFITWFSSYADQNAYLYHRCFLYFLNSLYFICFVIRFFLISIFFAALFNVKIEKDIPTIITLLVTVVITVLILIAPWNDFIYVLSEDGKYARGKFFLLTYIANITTLLLDTYYLIKYRKILNIKGIVSSIFTILALLACCLVDLIFVTYLVTDMFILFAILILFLAFENPDNFIDKKTGLYNFQAFSSVMQEFLIRQKNYSIINFVIQSYPEKKQIYGAKQIDLVLVEIGKFFMSLSHTKKCFYLQNGKFAVIENTSKSFESLRKDVLKRFEQPWIVNNSELHLNILILDMDDRVCFKSLEGISLGFGLAYEQTKQTTNTHITITPDSYNKIIRKTKVIKALDKALLEDDLQLYLQPIVEASSRKIIGAEALVRILDKELGLILPGEFISLAEKNGCIEQLGEQVLNKVCRFFKETNIYDYGIKWINVNLSPVQCQNKNLSERIENITNINTIDHKYIHLEITEESMIETPKLQKQMNILVTNGYKFSLDDFGSGFSNLSKVKSFPFNNIKLDMSIVQEHFKAPDDMLPNIVKTFTSRGLSVTAEGVETEEMATALENMGCNFLQGYAFSKPIPVAQFQKLVLSKKDLH